MDTLEKRVTARMAEERKELQHEQMALGKRRVKLGQELEKCLSTVTHLASVLGEPKALSASELDKLRGAEKHIVAITRELTTNARKSVENSARLEALENGKELERRVKAAKKLGLDGQQVTGPDAAEVVLLHNGGPMSVREISRTLLETGIVKLKGKTPEQTISAYLAKAAKKGDRFVRVDPATYDLKDRAKVSA